MRNKKLKKLEDKIYNLTESFCDINLKKEKFVPGKTYIPASGRVIDSLEIKNLISASLDGWLTTGRFNKNFQNTLAKYLGVKNLITVNSGSSANLIAFS